MIFRFGTFKRNFGNSSEAINFNRQKSSIGVPIIALSMAIFFVKFMTFQEQQLNVNSCAMSTHGNKWLAETIKIANNLNLNLNPCNIASFNYLIDEFTKM